MTRPQGIAIIGLDCRFPGARDAAAFWQNLKNGVESISFFTNEQLVDEGVDPDLLQSPGYIKARSLLDEVDLFDAEFFGFSPKEAENMDPQQRVFLETAWKALESAGYDAEKYDGAIGIFAGCYLDTYLLANLCTDREFIEELLNFKKVGAFQTFLGNDKDYLTSRVAYKLNLKGPAITVQTACSTSLVAICQACQSLLQGQCDMALAGGVTITFPQKKGYLYQEGGMLSPDGHCRAFDANAQGTVFGSGIGLVVLKRLEDALAEGDSIQAVIKGSALNNDGSVKVSYTAPSVDGQAEVITLAQALAGVTADTITYVEAHGTATPLGDPIEIAGLTQAFRQTTNKKGFCAIGSVKTNIGHLDVAAGVAGLIKTALALKHRLIPPSLNFTRPNPKIDFADSPFYVNARLSEWNTNGAPRRAGVSSFGVGGTNAHVVLEEAPGMEATGPSRPLQLLLLSARSDSALNHATKNLAAHLKSEPEPSLGDVAFTLQTGRRDFKHRRMSICSDTADAVVTLERRDPKRVSTQVQELRGQPVAFMFPGQGAQCVNMGVDLYRSESVFREEFDRCAEILRPHLELDLRHILFPTQDQIAPAEEQLVQTRIAQPALFAMEYAMARLWMSWGIRPSAMIGHSVGEYVAGCLAGVFTLEASLRLIAERARLVQEQPRGAMVAVRLSEEDLRPLLSHPLSVAAMNAPNLCVVSGPFDVIETFEKQLEAKGIAGRRLKTSHAFHSGMMEPVVAPFAELLKQTMLKAPQIPSVSNVTGRWVTDAEAIDPNFWAAHVRLPVRFAEGIGEFFKETRYVLLEVGPGQTLATLTCQHPGCPAEQTVLASLSLPGGDELRSMLTALGKLWMAGVDVDWKGFYAHERRRRVSLPTYPFERKRHWVEPKIKSSSGRSVASEAAHPRASELQPTSNGTPPMPEPQPATTPNREERILTTLRAMFHEMSGVGLATTDTSATFLELGFDSLFLTQARQSLLNKFGVKLTYRQLMEDASTLAALAVYIDGQLPPEALSVPDTALEEERPSSLHPSPFSGAEEGNASLVPARDGGTASLERIMNQQLQAMSQLITKQLAALRNGQADEPAEVDSEKTFVPGKYSGAFDRRNPSKLEQKRKATTEVQNAGARGTATQNTILKPFGPYRPVQKASNGGLTERQRRWLDGFIDRYARRTANSKRQAETYRRSVADPRSVAGFRSTWKELVYQIVVERASGSRLWDIDANEYIDVTMGFGVNLFGHSPAFITEAATEQLRKGVPIGPQSPLAGEVADLIREFTGAERVTFCNTGSEAVMAALRIARTVTGRSRIAYFSGDYHGMFDEVLLRPNNVNGALRSLPVAPGIPLNVGEEVLILDYGSAESLDILRARANELAAVLVEPVQSRHPDLHPKEFLHEIRRLTQQSGTILIFDEVITGFRVHPGGAQAMLGVQPDLTTYGKVVGGGFPIGVLAGKSGCMDALDGGFWQFGDDSSPEADMTFFAGTFVRHPLALAAAKASLLHLKERGPALQEELNRTTSEIVKAVNRSFESLDAPIRLMHFGSLFRFHFPPEWPFAPLFIYQMLENGIYVREAHQNCFLSTAHTPADINRIIEVVKACVNELQEAEFLPGPGADSAPHDTPKAGESTEPTGPVPLTESQKEIWLAAQLSPEASCAYNESLTAKLRGSMNIEALCGAVGDIVVRHQALRTVISHSGDTQQFLPTTALKLDMPVIDLSTFGGTARQSRLAEILKHEAGTPFDLVQGPLVRVQLARLDEQLHLFIFTAHHLICDGWSSSVLLSELGQFYSARAQDRTCLLEAAPEFSGFARAQESRLNSPEGAEEEAWWLQQFAEPVPVLELPTDHSRSNSRIAPAGIERVVISSALHQALKRAGAQLGSTLFSVLLAAFNILLHRLSRQEQVAVGIFTSGQAMLGWDKLVGHCVNMLPIRSNVVGQPNFRDYLKRLKALILDAHEHGNYTYGRLLQKLQLPRHSSHAPLVQVVFNLERQGDETASFHGLKVEVDQNPHHYVLFDLFLNIREATDHLTLDLEYNSSLFEATTIQRWLRHYQTLLEGLIEGMDKPVSQLPLLTGHEQWQMIDDWNQTAVEFPRDRCLHELFEEQATRSPDATALVWQEQRWSYEELNRQADRLADRLRELNVRSETLVGLCVERSPEMVASILAILKAGGAYVPLDPAYPKERLAFILEDTRAAVLVTTQALQAHCPLPSDCQLLCIDDPPDTPQTTHRAPRAKQLSNSLAYVIYTSGSTGKPKGVAIEHHSAVALVHWARSVFSAEELAGVLASTSICFDLSVFELFVPLSSGGTVILAENALHLGHLPARGEVTLINTVPSAITELLRLGNVPESVRTINLAGELLPTALVREVCRLPGVKKVYDLYGPSESTTYSTFALRGADELATIGRPIANTQIYLLDSCLQPMPVGVPGEIFIGGEGLARGYLNRPELTAGKFIPNPFKGDKSALLYRTGDLARYLSDGRIEFLGRLDQQVKVRGYRIELGEIEAVLREHPSVAESAVVVCDDPTGDKRLAAYIVPRSAATVSGDQGEREWLSGIVSQFESGYSAAIQEANREPSLVQDPTLNIYGWSGLEKTGEEVAEWIEHVVSRILSFKPQRLLEIGCGTGLVLFRLAPEVAEYWATDLSQVAIDNIRERLRPAKEPAPEVKLRCQMADDFENIPVGAFDGVILNAVLEYFPSTDYLVRVLKGAANAVKPGGFIFVGAVPNLAAQEIFHISEQLSRAADADDTATVQRRARKRLSEDQRLLVSREFFHALAKEIPAISQVKITALRGRFENEASKLIADTYYDVILQINGSVPKPGCVEWMDWQKDRLNVQIVSQRLRNNQPDAIGIVGVPHRRMQKRLQAMERLDGPVTTIGELRRALALTASEAGLDELLSTCEKPPFTAEIVWSNSGADGHCDVRFERDKEGGWSVPAAPAMSDQPLHSFASNPLQAKLAHDLVPELRTFLQTKLPDYMVPAAFVWMEKLPLTPNGKMDRRALPMPGIVQAILGESYIAPRTPAEIAVAQIWCGVLHLPQVGVNDNFFELGGHSLHVTQVVARIRNAFQVELPMRQVFEQPTVIATVAAIEELLVEDIRQLSEDDARQLVESAS